MPDAQRGAWPQALIWDIDGTVAETERDGHRVAFNGAFADFGLPWQWDVDTYGRLLHVAGGLERLRHDLATRPLPPSADRERLAHALHRRKAALYAERVGQHGIALRPGVRALMDDCLRHGVPMAIATTTGRANVEALLAGEFGPRWGERFAAVVCAEDAPSKKPDPQAYLLVLQHVGCVGAAALAIEDSPNGLAAARAAGITTTIVTRSVYFAGAAFSGAWQVCDDLAQAGLVSVESLRRCLEHGAGVPG